MNAKRQNLLHEALSSIFHTIKLNKDVAKGTGLLGNEEINKNISSKFIPSGVSTPRNGPLLDPKAVYPLNKAGGFGVLYRDCVIVDKGI